MATKKTSSRKSATTTRTKKPATSASPKKRTAPARAPSSAKVDYYPNRMTVAVSTLAGTILVLVAVIAVLGMKN